MRHDLYAVKKSLPIYFLVGKKGKMPVTVYIIISFTHEEGMHYLLLCASHSSKLSTHTYSFIPHNSIKLSTIIISFIHKRKLRYRLAKRLGNYTASNWQR